MSKGDKALRSKSIPFISNFIGNTSTYGEGILSNPTLLAGDLRTVAIPMTRPEKCDIIEAYLFMQMTAPSDSELNVRIGIGTFSSGVIPDTEYSEAYLDQQHRKITGSDSPLNVAANGTLYIDADLTRSLHVEGDAEFNSDAFVLLVTFYKNPDPNNGYSLDEFKLSCTAQMGFTK